MNSQPDADTLSFADYADPVSELVHHAVISQPVDAVARLVELLERTPHGRSTVDEVLTAAATRLPVEQVAQLAHLLSQPPRPGDGADLILRTAAQQRPIAEVSHLVTLLHQPPHTARAGLQAAHTAAGHRPVEDLAQLIDALAQQRLENIAADPGASMPSPDSEDEYRPRQVPETGNRLAVRWLSHMTAAALLATTAAHLPWGLYRAPSLLAHVAAIGLPVLCGLVAALLLLKSTMPRLAAGFLLSAAMVARHVLDGVLPISWGHSNTFLPPLAAGIAAALAALLSLVTLVRAFVVPQQPHTAPALAPTA
ncbi:hypothetical protein [Streptomyces chrestomyceticus]|uniref:hypothetical protein n=1 Tax=Streptomyces chrestomyceticus TaxID=68185 RepID=UPI0033D30C5B